MAATCLLQTLPLPSTPALEAVAMAYPSRPGDTLTSGCGPAGTRANPTDVNIVPAMHDKPSWQGSPFMNE
jgi:hypothetical protein